MSGYVVSATEYKTIGILLKREERLLNSFCILDALDSTSETARTLERIRHLIPLIESMAVHTLEVKGVRGKHVSIRLNETQQQDLILVLQKEAHNIQIILQRTAPEASGANRKKQSAMEVLLKKIQNTSGAAL